MIRWGLALLIAVTACALRFPLLDERPMHADEAIHADKFGTLLDSGSYRYDPTGYHGPALPYLTLISAAVAGSDAYADLAETELRMVSVLAGVLLVMAPLLLVDGLPRQGVYLAALLAAISPPMVYYSRYYIPEMLLAAFTFGVIVFGYRYAREPSIKWMLPAAVCAGLAYATKETWIIAFAAAALALLLSVPLRDLRRALRPLHLSAGAGLAFLVGAALYTSLLSNPSGLPDSFRAFASSYVSRAFDDPLHLHPWHFYWTRCEPLVLILAVVGFGTAVRKKGSRLPRFLAWYVMILAACYTLIPYKTPWNFLSVVQGITVLAGLGAWTIIRSPSSRRMQAVAAVVFAVFAAHLAWQAWRASYPYSSDPRNPYVYAHTGKDVYRLRQAIEEVAAAHEDGHAVEVDIFTTANLWPLPWYLREFPNVRWWREVSGDAPLAPIVLATPEMEEALVERMYESPAPGRRELYMHLFDERLDLRPGLEVRGYIPKSLWDRLRETRR